MDFTQQPLFRLMIGRMDYLGQRQKLLAENIANADTPGYQSRDLRQLDFLKALGEEQRMLSPVLTNARHLPPVRPADAFNTDKDKRPYETKPDRNSVVLEEQSLKVAQTQLAYGATTTLMKRYIEMLKTAASFRG